jgi:hypothetical protein
MAASFLQPVLTISRSGGQRRMIEGTQSEELLARQNPLAGHFFIVGRGM